MQFFKDPMDVNHGIFITTYRVKPMKIFSKISLVLLTGIVCGCKTKTQAPTGVISAAQTQALKDAKNIEKQLLDAEQAQREQLNDTSQ